MCNRHPLRIGKTGILAKSSRYANGVDIFYVLVP
jgi:hypothetical protein